MGHDFEEFARVNDPRCPCPVCGKPCTFASNFKKFGEHRVRVCATCKTVTHNDDKPEPIEVTEGVV